MEKFPIITEYEYIASNDIAAIYSACNIGRQSYEHHLVKSYEILENRVKIIQNSQRDDRTFRLKNVSEYFVSLKKPRSFHQTVMSLQSFVL